MSIAYKIIAIIVALVIITKFLAPLLVSLFPPFGVLILILLYLAVAAYALGWNPLP